MGMKNYCCFAFVIYLLHQQSGLHVSAQNRIRYVSSNGTDTGNCTKQMPCRTLNYTIFNDSDCSTTRIADNSTIMVEDGTYNMTKRGLVLCDVSNITIRAVNPGEVRIQCECFNCTINDRMYGNVFVWRANNVTFEGMVFEKCGYDASNVFVRNTTGLTLRNCVFR